MSITDELREYTSRHEEPCLGMSMAAYIRGIADRIDAEHERRMVERADRYSELRNKMNNCYIELPKDADGVPWHRGDRVIDPKDPDGKVNTVWIAGDNTLITDDHLFIFSANELRHYHAPTVEDVLREFANEVYADADNEIRDRDFLCAKYAKRLTLAEGEDA